MTADERLEYWYSCEVSHYPDYAWEETLAVIQEEPRSRGTLLADLMWLTGQLVGQAVKMPRLVQEDQEKFLRRSELGDADRFRAVELIEAKRRDNVFDVFLCHNSEDKPLVREIAEQLRQHGLLPWLDDWELRPGLPWQALLADQIDNIESAAVFIGSRGIGPWQDLEIRGILQEFAMRRVPIIPVILPNALETSSLPAFLEDRTGVDFRHSNPDPMERLIWGITGKRQRLRSREEFS